MAEEVSMTDDVRNLIGDPRKAIVSTSIPIALSNFVQTANNLIDAAWVAGLGTAALTATNVVFPFFFTMIGIGNGIGVGAAQAVARRIGEKDYEGSNRVAAQAVFLSLVIGVILTAVFLVFAEPIMVLGSAGSYMEDSLAYGIPVFIGSIPIVFSCVIPSLLRAEGAAKRSMYVGLVGAGLNIVLDPVFIYLFGLGVSGAGWATVAALTAADVLGLYWYFVKKDTFVKIPMAGFRFDSKLDWDILRVGIPASLEIMMIAITDVVMNAILSGVDPVSGIAVYGTGWKVINMLTIPIIALGYALVPISAAAYGAKDYRKLKEGYHFTIKFGFIVMTAMMVLALLFAPWMVKLFSYNDPELNQPIVEFIRIVSLFIPFSAFGFVSNSLFQGLGMGVRSFECSLALNVFRLPVCALLATFGVLSYVWWGLTSAELFGAAVTFVWATITVRSIVRDAEQAADEPSDA